MARVVISGYYGFRNTGDEAILRSILHALERLGHVEAVVLSGDPALTRLEHGVEAIQRTNLVAIIRALWGSDALVSGGGSLLQDATGALSIPYYLGVILLARVLGKPVVVYGQGVGPVSNPFYRFLIRVVLDRVETITVRDQGSAAFLRELGVRCPPVEVTADAVFSLPLPAGRHGPVRGGLEPGGEGRQEIGPEGEPAAGSQAGQGTEPEEEKGLKLQNGDGEGDGTGDWDATASRVVIGVALRSWEVEFEDRLAAALNILTDRFKARIVFLPMQLPGDREVSQRVREQMKEPGRLVTLDSGAGTPERVLEALAGIDLLVGMRLHALIFAAIVGVPMVGLCYDPKVTAFLQTLGLPGAVALDGFEPEELVERVVQTWENRKALVRSMESGVRGMRRRAEGNNRALERVLGRGGGLG